MSQAKVEKENAAAGKKDDDAVTVGDHTPTAETEALLSGEKRSN